MSTELTPIVLLNVREWIKAFKLKAKYATASEIKRLRVGEHVTVQPLGKEDVAWFVKIESREGDYFTGEVVLGDSVGDFDGQHIAFHACNILAAGNKKLGL